MKILRSHRRRTWALALTAAMVLTGAACSSGTTTSTGASSTSGPTTITVAVAYPAPPAAMLDQFTKQTGIKVDWVNIGWDDLQTKIAAAMTSNAYFADATDVDWSKVGEYYKTGWFYPLNKWFSISSLRSDMPQLNTFVVNNELIGVPFDSSFMVTTINTKDFKKAGISAAPTTLSTFSADLKKVATATGMSSPLDIQLATAEGLSTCWYQMTAAFGGQVLSSAYDPEFTSPASPGYQAMNWIVNAYKTSLVPKGNINVTDYDGFTTEMAKNRVAGVLCDYSGSVASIYNVASSSSVVNQTEYVQTPGATGPGPAVANPDGIGIPKNARNPQAAAEFIKWFTDTENQAIWAGLKGPNDVVPTFPLPARLSSFALLSKAGDIGQASQLAAILSKHAQAPFPNGAPPWYAQFSNSVQTNIHQAAIGAETVQQAVNNIASEAQQLKASE